MKPICHRCHCFFRPKKNGYYFTEGMPSGQSRAPRGLAAPEQWKPYKIFSGDLWECPECEVNIIVGTGIAIRINHESDFEAMRETLGAHQFQVNDC